MNAEAGTPRWDTDLPAKEVRRLSYRDHRLRIAASLGRKVLVMEGFARGADWCGPIDPPLTRTALRGWVDPGRRLWPWGSSAVDALGGPHDALVRRFLDAVETVRELRSGRRVPCQELLARERRKSDRMCAQLIEALEQLRECRIKLSLAPGRGG